MFELSVFGGLKTFVAQRFGRESFTWTALSKSIGLISPLAVFIKFDGLQSRQIHPAEWTSLSSVPICIPYSRTCLIDSRRTLIDSNFCSVSPSTNSVAMKVLSPRVNVEKTFGTHTPLAASEFRTSSSLVMRLNPSLPSHACSPFFRPSLSRHSRGCVNVRSNARYTPPLPLWERAFRTMYGESGCEVS